MSDLYKIADDLSNLTLLEASQLARMLRELWGIKESVSNVMKSADHLVSVIEDSTEDSFYDLHLKSFGKSKIEVIKLIRQFRDLGLKEAKDLVETEDALLLSTLDKETADALMVRFHEIGALTEKVRI